MSISRHHANFMVFKERNSVALSTTEVEYISASSCCAQILWMKQQLKDYGIDIDTIPIKCDNASAIYLTKNPIQHSRTKHIEITHHLLEIMSKRMK